MRPAGDTTAQEPVGWQTSVICLVHHVCRMRLVALQHTTSFARNHDLMLVCALHSDMTENDPIEMSCGYASNCEHETVSSSGLDHLDMHLLAEVLQHVPPQGLCQARLACRRLDSASRSLESASLLRLTPSNAGGKHG